MALVKCKECGKEVSNKASKCPGCGAKVPKKTSPVTWFALFAVLFVVYVTSTSPDKASSNASSTSSSSSSTSSTASSDKPETPVVPKEPQWRSFDSTDEMSGERSAYAISPTVGPTSRMEFPYTDVESWVGVGCDRSTQWAYVAFNNAPNLNDTEIQDGYNLIKTRVKWGDSLVRETLTQAWGAKSLHFRNRGPVIQKIAGSVSMLLELKWHGQGAVRFDYPLKGSAKAIAKMKATCGTF